MGRLVGEKWLKVPQVRIDGVLGTRTFCALFLVCFYYLSYRYPFQINSSGTSPVYVDTPAWLQTGKYLIIAVVAIVASTTGLLTGQTRSRREDRGGVLVATLLFVMAVFAIGKGLLLDSVEIVLVGVFLAIGVLLCSLFVRWPIDAAEIARCLSVFAVVAVLVEAAQVLFFVLMGRLPALAYANSTSVRFGSILDDPNGFAIVVALLVPVVLVGWSTFGKARLIVVAALLGSLVLTQSFTGISAVLAAFLLGYSALKWRTPSRAVTILWTALLAAGVSWYFLSTSALIEEIWVTKAGSFDAHSTSMVAVGKLDMTALMGLGPANSSIESSYVSLVANFGLPFTLAYLGVGLLALVRLYRSIASAEFREEVAMQQGFFFFIVAYLIASVNLKLEASFPVNLLYLLGVCISFFGTNSSVWQSADR